MTPRICPNGCGPADKSQKFCRVCGTRLVTQVSPTPEAASVQTVQPLCPNCGSANLPDKRFCRMCGTALILRTAEEIPASPSKSQAQPVSEGEAAGTAEQSLCPACGMPADLAQRFCRSCGKRLQVEPEVQPAASTPPVPIVSGPVSEPEAIPIHASDVEAFPAPGVAENMPIPVSAEQALPEHAARQTITAPRVPFPAAPVSDAYPELEKPKKEPAPTVVPSVLSSTFAQKPKTTRRWVLAVPLFLGAVGLVVAFFVFRPAKTTQTAVKPQKPSSTIVELQQQGRLHAPIQQQVPPPPVETPESQPSPPEASATPQQAPDPQVEALKQDLQNRQAELELEKRRLAEQQKALEAQRQEELARQAQRDAERVRQDELNRQRQLEKQQELEQQRDQDSRNNPRVQAPYQGPTSGTIVWEGEVAGAELITIENGTASSGRVTGMLPGVACLVQSSDPKRVSVATAPGPSNQWKRIVLRIQGKGRMTVKVTWALP